MDAKSKTKSTDLGPDDDDDWDAEDDDLVVEVDETIPPSNIATGPRPRNWRDLERYKEELELKKLMDEDKWLDDL